MPGFFKPHYVKGGLVLYLHMDDIVGGQVLDVSGQSNHGTIYGAIEAVGKRGMGLSFDGVNDYVRVTDSASLDLTSQATIELWTKTTQEAIEFWFSKHTEGLTGYESHLNANGTVRFLIHHKTPTYTGLDTAKKVNDGNWHHIVHRFDSGAMRVFIDGVQDTVTATAPVTSIPVNNTNLFIGIRDTLIYKFNGLIDEVRIYNRALSAAEIKYNFLGCRDIMRC